MLIITLLRGLTNFTNKAPVLPASKGLLILSITNIYIGLVAPGLNPVVNIAETVIFKSVTVQIGFGLGRVAGQNMA